ncbi:hypothetical protein [Tindallia californiensis]|uniref:Uncharacterized protein n=1 Tax=Tindallia californiensis TaxID=159292 RepID=A0A1H3RFA8_9FIRM|nr:hypothetical protein [Tindallia californiensis]SDZ24253.1 hypothetical protein SAMN05192546_1206 [Tindallia californiensis]
MAKGFVKLHRDIQEHWLWGKDTFSKGQAFMDMVMLASHEEVTFPHGNQLITLQRGQFLSSIEKLAKKWGWGEKKARNFFNLLIRDGMLSKDSTKRFTVFTILNYEKWQGEGSKESRTEAELKPGRRSPKSRTETLDSVSLKGNKAGQKPDKGDFESSKKADIQEMKKKEIKKKGKEETEAESKKIPYQRVVELFHSACPSFPRIIKLTDARKKTIAARWKEYDQGIKPFFQLFNAAESSDFLKGKNERKWRANFDWLMKSDNMAKALEGNYGNKKGGEGNERYSGECDQYKSLGIDLDQLEV